MSIAVRNIFVFVFVFNIFSLTLQASITNFCKENKGVKIQTQANTVTEEEERHESDDAADEVFYTLNDFVFNNSERVIKTYWLSLKREYRSYSKPIPIPPPKF